MRDRETIDAELWLLAAVRWSIRQHGEQPGSRQVDELLDDGAASTLDVCPSLETSSEIPEGSG